MPQLNLVTDVSQVTPAWLTTTLAQNGYIGSEHVVTVRIKDRQATGFHQIVRLHATYSQDTAAPSHFILKFSQPDRHVRVPENGWEVTFYNQLAAHMPHAPVLRCYDAVFSAQHGKVHVLLEDVSALCPATVPCATNASRVPSDN